MVLHQWGSSTPKFSFISGVDHVHVNNIDHRTGIPKLINVKCHLSHIIKSCIKNQTNTNPG